MTAPPRPPRLRLWLLLALGGFFATVGLFAALALVGIERSKSEILRAEQSLGQLENVRAVEAAFNLYLLGELRRRVQAEPGTLESPAAGQVRGSILAYRAMIGEEIQTAESDAERDAERLEMVRASALSSIFETIETEAMLDRAGRSGGAPADAARRFLVEIAAGRDEVFGAVVQEVLADERAEAAEAFRRLEELRATLFALGGGLAGGVAVAVAGLGLVFWRTLMRPIGQLAQAAERLPAADGTARVPEDLPAEFATLARRFNAMAERIGSEQSRLQAEVAARTAELETANAALTRIDASRRAFFADVSHELRTPVTVLLGEAQIALRTPGQEPEALARIAETGRFLRRRLDDLLQLARSEDGRLRLSLREMDLAETVKSALGPARAYAEMNGVALALDCAGPAPVRGDPGAIGQAALALVDNAVKFTPEGGTVEVTVHGRTLTVADRGPGFGTTDPEALFARYAQEGRGASRGGAGLGLAIVKWIADEHGARLSAANRAEGGASVSLEFGE